MNKRLGKESIQFISQPKILGHYSIAGKKEGDGPIGKYIDLVFENAKWEEKTFEKAELKVAFELIANAISNAKLNVKDIDVMLAGDLLNQIISSNYAARCFDVPFLGLYGACSTMVESLILGACLIDGGFYNVASCSSVSHFATAERQYRGPLELGSQRAPYSQWTVTGGGCCILGQGNEGVKIRSATIGKVLDYGILDVNNMGAAMAPAAADTMVNHFKNNKTNPDSYDLIVTGDLGKLGSDIARDLMKKHGFELKSNYKDCGHLIYNLDQKVSQGGSGAGCSAVVLTSYLIKKLISKEVKKVLLVGTGALMSTTISQQGESIPAIAHAVELEA